jgi:putative DNA primase/helicase
MKSKVSQLPEIKLLAIAEDKAGGGFLAVLQFRDIDAKKRKLMLPKAELLRTGELRRTLENAGCFFSDDAVENNLSLKRISKSARDIPRWRFADSMGWHNNHQLFVLPRSVIGNQRSEIILKPPRLQAASCHVRRKGNLSTWKTEVAGRATYSSRMVCGICASFAAVTLDFVGLPSFMINVFGAPKSAKSTALLAASSAYGYGREKDLPNFRTTDAAFGEIPAAFNHMMLPVNELGLLTGSRADRYGRLRDLAYGFSEGNGTTYSEKYLAGSAGSRKAWQSIAIVNGEQSWN